MSLNLLLLHRICRFSTSTQLSKSIRPKKTNGKKKNAGISEKFLDKAKLWPMLLKADADEQMKKLNDMIKLQEEWSSIEKRGLCVANLDLHTIGHDLFSGRNVVLNLRNGKQPQKWVRPLTPITLSRINEENELVKISDGHIMESDRNSIKCAIYDNKKEMNFDENYIILPSSNSPTITAMKKIMENPGNLSDNSKHLVNLTYRAIQMPSLHDRKINSLTETLNESQVAAVSAVMNSQRNLLCIQGPPGTGKTRVIAECVLKLIEKNKKVVICAPTHVAVTNVYNSTIRKMKENGWNQERIENCLLSITEGYNDQLEKHEKYPLILEHSKKFFDSSDETAKSKIQGYIHKMKKDAYVDIFGSKMAIFSTLNSSMVKRLKMYGFDGSTIIIDEAAQCTEPATWIPILSMRECKKVVLVGDHKQLPAVVLSDESRKYKLDVSLMQRLTEEFEGCNVNILLKEQYRMNSKIMNWSNDSFYNSQLSSHETVENICLSDLYPNLPSDNPINSPTIMINMDQIKNRTKENRMKSITSYINQDEIEMISKYVNRLIVDVGVDPSHIAVIAPYYAQIEQLRKVLSVDVNTVDAFQGDERQIIIFCLVRDNEEGYIGFLRDSRRLNVAVTRAKRQFVMIASAKMMRSSKDLRKLLSHFEKEKCIYGEEIFDNFENVKLPTGKQYRY